MNIMVFGVGDKTKRIIEQLGPYEDYLNIIGFLDNDSNKHGIKFFNKTVYHPGELNKFHYDKIIICSSFYKEIKEQLVYGYGISESLIENEYFLLKMKMINKYKNSNDNEINEIVSWLKDNKLSVFTRYIDKTETLDEVTWDVEYNMPYIMFENKRMYYPRDYNFKIINGKQYLINILKEQETGSPHLYIKDEINIKKNDVIVDAGVCEGNFALKYVDIASKIYLIECNPKWCEALKLTFKDYMDKVVICNKMLTNKDASNMIRLDSLVKEKIDFLKMDIEGYEVEALEGARETLMNSNTKCAICGYHKKNADIKISEILKSFGYNTSYSNGYMIFIYDEDIFFNADFRHGIVYGKK